MTDDQKRRMQEGRKRAAAERAKSGKTKRTRKPKAPPSFKFNVDDDGSLAILDERGAGFELTVADARRLRDFLVRALPAAGCADVPA